MRKNVDFLSNGLKCREWFYVPDHLAEGQKVPAVVMAHGFSAVKEMHLSNYAEKFCAAGMAVLVFDYRFLGEGEGEPRGQVLPHTQMDDYRNALSWVGRQPVVDALRIGVWGSSYSGGHVIHLSAFDRRIKAAVAQVPNVSGWRSILKYQGMDGLRALQEMVNANRAASYPDRLNYFPVVAPDGQPAVLSTPDSYEFFMGTNEDGKKNWINGVTIESIEKLIENEPADAIELISPTALLIIAAENDLLIPIEAVRDAFKRAGEPKKLAVIPCGHFDCYELQPWHDQAVASALDWFSRYLRA